MVLADELEADWKRVKVLQATGDVKHCDQNTDGSRSTWQFYQPMRSAGASTRQMLEAAAQMWNVDIHECRARNHVIVHVPTGRQILFGDAAKVAATLSVLSPDHMDLQFKPASEHRYIGKPMPIVDLHDIVQGKTDRQAASALCQHNA
jgi:isoquinoline 1-oxidoreductase subunit beta